MPKRPTIIKVAMPVPLDRLFDYRLPADLPIPDIGARVSAQFGSRRMTGVVLALAENSELPASKLKNLVAVIDTTAVLPTSLLELLRWTAGYYHYPVGEVLAAALPATLRSGKPAEIETTVSWRLTEPGRGSDPQQLKRAPVQQQLLQQLQESGEILNREQLEELSANWRNAMRGLVDKGLVEELRETVKPKPAGEPVGGPTLNPEQAAAAESINAANGYQAFLLSGVTGSGKTEVYPAAIDRQLAAGKQVLMLVPEIGLTPQLVARLQQRIAQPVLALHSGLSDGQRHNAWLQAATGEPLVVLGTRSAIFTPLPRLGLVIVDEEHDRSFKQQDGFRYHARDIAVMRASRERVPVVLGSATPSLESMHNVASGNYSLLDLTIRAGGAQLPRIGLIDMKQHSVHDGLSPPLVTAIGERLDRGEQSLLFLNRRGYAPVIMCRDCGWIQHCPRCDAHMIMHRQKNLSRCHHCGSETPLPTACPGCESTNLKPVGEGTERVEQALAKLFPAARIDRIDRDTTARKGALEQKLKAIHDHQVDIVVGTQMLSKGHDFPMITLVGVLNADQGLYGVDFRGPEHLIQQVMQVSGRAGRAEHEGEVLIQTWHPQHPVFQALMTHDYGQFVEAALHERQAAGFPPYTNFVLLRAESTAPVKALAFLDQVAKIGTGLAAQYKGVQIFDAISAPMEKRAGRYRAQLLVSANGRGLLHQLLNHWLPRIENLPDARKVRWSVDVDPVDMY